MTKHKSPQMGRIENPDRVIRSSDEKDACIAELESERREWRDAISSLASKLRTLMAWPGDEKVSGALACADKDAEWNRENEWTPITTSACHSMMALAAALRAEQTKLSDEQEVIIALGRSCDKMWRKAEAAEEALALARNSEVRLEAEVGVLKHELAATKRALKTATEADGAVITELRATLAAAQEKIKQLEGRWAKLRKKQRERE